MMNYIWAGLIVAALGFALFADAGDIARDRYANHRPLAATIEIPPIAATDQTSRQVVVSFDETNFVEHFHRAQLSKSESATLQTKAELVKSGNIYELRLTEANLLAPLGEIRAFNDEANKILRAQVIGLPTELTNGEAIRVPVTLQLPPVRFVKIKNMTTAGFEAAKTAATLALGFIGVFALWMGLMKIAEASGLVNIFVLLVQPFLRFLFPEVPKGHPALGMIAMNLAANMLGLGNAATPMGLKAMEELQKLNPKKDTATNPMVMLLAINTAGVQLLPSATLVAVMGMSSLRVFIPILIVTGISLIIAIIMTRLLGKLKQFKSTDPNLPNLSITEAVQ